MPLWQARGGGGTRTAVEAPLGCYIQGQILIKESYAEKKCRYCGTKDITQSQGHCCLTPFCDIRKPRASRPPDYLPASCPPDPMRAVSLMPKTLDQSVDVSGPQKPVHAGPTQKAKGRPAPRGIPPKRAINARSPRCDEPNCWGRSQRALNSVEGGEM